MVEVVAPVQDQGRHERVRGVSLIAKALGERDRLLTERVGAVVPNTMRGRVEAREDRSVRRHRDGSRGDGVGCTQPLGCQLVDVRRPGKVEPVTANVVGPRRVDRDDQDVPMGGPAAGEEEQTGEGNGQELEGAVGHERQHFILELCTFSYTYRKSPLPSAAMSHQHG